MPPRAAAASSATPARMTRAASKTPMPPVAVGQSAAYGAPGSRAQEPRRGHRSGRPSEILEEGAEMGPGGTPSPAPEAPPSPRPSTGNAGHDARYSAVISNLLARIARWLLPRSLPSPVFLALSLGFLLGIFALWVPAPRAIEASRQQFKLGMDVAFAVPPYDRPPAFLERAWNQYKHDVLMSKEHPGVNLPELQWAINIGILERLEKLESRVTIVENRLALTSDTLAEIRDMLPARVLLNIVDGKPEIPAELWSALEARLVEKTDMAPHWQAWVLRNEERIAEYMESYASTTFHHALETGQIVQREELLKALDERNNYLTAQYRDEILDFFKQQGPKLEEIASRSANTALENIPTYNMIKTQISALLRFNHVQNTYNALRSTNWFSPALGARVDPHFTSPTKIRGAKNWLMGIYMGMNPFNTPPNPPIAALVKWDEASECWCGAPDQDGAVQLAVVTESFYPEKLIIEHITPQATRNIEAAPKDFEVWMDFHTKDKAKQARKEIDKWYSEEVKTCSKSPGPTWICMIKNRYDVHHDNHIQSFEPWFYPIHEQLATKHMLFRATSNWGANYTCIYRVRMTGSEAPEPVMSKGWFGWF